MAIQPRCLLIHSATMLLGTNKTAASRFSIILYLVHFDLWMLKRLHSLLELWVAHRDGRLGLQPPSSQCVILHQLAYHRSSFGGGRGTGPLLTNLYFLVT